MARQITCAILLALSACTRQSDLEQRAMESIRATAKDPDSIKFSNVSVDDKAGVVCGEFVGKNSFGAYAGQEAFVYQMTPKLESDPDFDDLDKKCVGTDTKSVKRRENIGTRAMRNAEAALEDWEKKGSEAAAR